MNKEIAIIIPAYNAHDTIERLLFSILNQSVKDICRVYLIDDYSEKDYFYLIDKFPWLDMVICRLDENSGPGVARNKGLELVIEDDIPYIVFADADDCFYEHDSLKKMYYPMKADNYDRVEAIFSTELEEYEKYKTLYTIGRDADVWLFAKMYRTEIIKKNNISFPPLSANEDVAFNAFYILYCQTNFTISEVVYIWKNNPLSITRKDPHSYNVYSLNGLIDGLIYVFKQIENNPPKIEKIKSFVINRALRFYLEILNMSEEEYKQEYEEPWKIPFKKFYDHIYQPYESLIKREDVIIEWNEIASTGKSPYPYISFENFIKKIRAI